MKKVREKLNAKLRKSGGFTLVEMLIVVAIIAILIAVSIPMFSSTLEKARHGVDAANLRDVVSLATAEYLADLDPKETFKNKVTYIYEVDSTTHQGELVETGTGVEPQCTCGGHATDGLSVDISLDANGKPVIKPNWKIDTDGSTKPNT